MNIKYELYRRNGGVKHGSGDVQEHTAEKESEKEVRVSLQKLK